MRAPIRHTIYSGVFYGTALLLLLALSTHSARAQGLGGVQTWSASDFTADSVLSISHTWNYRPGDSLAWAEPGYDDSGWELVGTHLGPAELPFIDWEGVGWFRLRLKVDSSLANRPLALLMSQHNGASEIYMDGELIYRLGEISVFAGEYRPYRDSRPRPVVFPDTAAHLLAVRFVNHDAQTYIERGYNAGFRLRLGDLNSHLRQADFTPGPSISLQLFFGGILLAFTAIHFLLFAFYPSEKRNLYFAFFTGVLALLTYFSHASAYTNNPLEGLAYARYEDIAWVLMALLALRFTYSLFYRRLPRPFWVFLPAGLLVAASGWLDIGEVDRYREIYVLGMLVEIARVLAVSFYRQREGVWIIGTGLSCFAGGVFYASLANMNIIAADPTYGSIYGAILLIFAMSIFLSRDFARTQKRLEHKLIEVKHLSERSLEQERINKQKELERKLLEAENERKSRELEEARALQLSMLPKNIPNSDNWDIAVFMETAQEVGGDYYDFHLAPGGEMTVALGDATGHGMKAGIIVATAKSYFHTLAGENDNLTMLRRMSSGIRNMDLKLLYMGMLLVRCRNHQVQVCAAGMPPVLVWRRETGTVETLRLRGMPLGSRVDYPYEDRALDLSEGDVILLMSDGLMELFNERRELLGMDRIRSALREVADSPSSNILSRLTRLIEEWAGSRSNEDDITLLVMKAK